MWHHSRTERKQAKSSWPKVIFKKWLNLESKVSDFSADEGDINTDYHDEDEEQEGAYCILRRRNSETLRAQYIDAKDIRICVGTWNVGGKVPHDDLDIDEWLNTNEPADMYVLGFQEVVPLNAGNIFGAEDCSPVPRWENLIRKSLNKVQTGKPTCKCYSDPPSPSRLKPSEDASAIIEKLLLHETDNESDNEMIQQVNDSMNDCDDFNGISTENGLSMKKLDKCHRFSMIDSDIIPKTPISQQNKLIKTFSGSEKIGLAWPEQPRELLARRVSDSPTLRSKSFKTCSPLASALGDKKDSLYFGSIQEFDPRVIFRAKKRSSFVRIIKKQMVGIFISIWARRYLQKIIQNVKVSSVGVGAMGYIGNKGSISVSMSVGQTQFCFICSHLSSGEKKGDELRRNADVQEINRRTRFAGLHKTIKDHERIFWFGDLNYRINLPYERAHELISAKKLPELFAKDQLKQELKIGGTFDGWKEGIIDFPPTYKFEYNSAKYVKDDSKSGRRTPAWCDRILTFGNGMKLLIYKRSELKVSDHRPVTATFLVEVEVFSHRKLQRALTLTDAEVDEGKIIEDIDVAVGMGRLML
ncbi:type IV inositol polyphosphate 5-phosphatase 3-like [Phalaenopsis equestris]|uniref:type IV inositol polyphosphate 5-phosphatase 3-like n=1 Tax=Phalaenopsis equestris TaxID=78828 RepID=UPI0009E3FC77|nr:type IV inositol polyphosphate 5-phosphatase 3-like [Phalaenopsis equestris]